MAATFIILLSLAIPGGDPAPYDWPQWRGPNRDAVSRETGLVKVWPKDGPPIAWVAKNLGGGYTTPSVAAGRVFGMSYRGSDEVVWALNESDGRELWVRRIAPKGKASYNDGPRSTPTIDSDRLYCVGISGDLVCLRTDTGSPIWTRNYCNDFGGEMMSGWGYSESVLVDGNLVICTPGGEKRAAIARKAIVALDKHTGKEVWAADVPHGGGSGYSSLIKAQVGGVKMYVTLLGKTCGTVGVRARDGKVLWQYPKIANGTANIPTCIYRDGYLVCSTGYPDGGYAVLKLTAHGNDVKAEEVAYHSSKELQNHHGGMVLVGDYVYMGRAHRNGFPTCVEFKTGKIVWEEERGPGAGSAAAVCADGRIYLRYENGLMALIDATPAGYNLISTFKLPAPSDKPSWPHPVIANGKLLIRDQDRLTAFNIKATP